MRIVFDVDVYLRRIGCTDVRHLDIGSLRTLHKRHLMSIPYNSRVPLASTYPDGRGGVGLVTIDEDAVFADSIVDGNGGVCFHLNRLFRRLLSGLGYDATLLAAATIEGMEYLDTDRDHMLIRVDLNGGEWLVDVGYPGPSYIEPLRLAEGIQVQYGCQYRMVPAGDYLELQRRGRTTRWSIVYRFQNKPQTPANWVDLEARLRRRFAQPQHDDETIQCGRTFDDGQVVIKGRRHLTVQDGRESVRTLIDEHEYRETIANILTGAQV